LEVSDQAKYFAKFMLPLEIASQVIAIMLPGRGCCRLAKRQVLDPAGARRHAARFLVVGQVAAQ
jgi:hypothetical protein